MLSNLHRAVFFLILHFIFIVFSSFCFANNDCLPSNRTAEGQLYRHLLDQEIYQCQKLLKSEACERYFFANPNNKNNAKTCSPSEIIATTKKVQSGTVKAVGEWYQHRGESLYRFVSDIPNLKLDISLEGLTFSFASSFFESLNGVTRLGEIAKKSIAQCFVPREVCLGQLQTIASAEIEKLKVQTQGFECLKPELQAQMLTIAVLQTANETGLSLEELALRNSLTRAGEKLLKKTPNTEGDSTPLGKDRRHNAKITVARSPARQALIDEMNEQKKSFLDRVHSKEFILRATETLSEANPKTRRLVVFRENSLLKDMNTETQDFDFVTALNLFDQMNFNHEFDLLLRRPENRDLFEELAKKDSNLLYRDGKSIGNLLSLKDLSAAQEERLVKLISEACLNNLKTATQKFQNLHRKPNSNEPPSPLPENLASAYKCGVGYNYITASHAARKARDPSQDPTVLSDFRNYGERIAPLKAKADRALDRALSLQGDLTRAEWKQLWNSENKMFHLEVFEALRKSGSAHELKFKLKEYTGVTLDGPQADKLFHYKTSIDALSPPFLDGEADILTFDDAHHGGLKSDFPNVGARNLQALAESLRDSKGVKDPSELGKIPQSLKRAEERVTKVLTQQKKELEDLTHKVFKNISCNAATGDDGATSFGCPIPTRLKQEFLSECAKNPLLKNTRFAFFASNVSEADRMNLSNHGEFLEKQIKSTLRKSSAFTPDDLKNLTMAIDLQGTHLWEGDIQLLLANPNRLSPAQKRQLDAALDEALKDLEEKGDGLSNYRRGSYFSTDSPP